MSSHKGPVSLVLSGGGARAAYQVGVLKYFAEQTDHLPFQIITGSSAGSLNAAVLAQHAPDFKQGVAHLEEIWTNLTTQQVYIAKALPLTWGLIKGLIQFLRAGKGRKLRQRGLFDSSPLMDLITRNMDFEKLHNKLEEGHLRALAITATGYSMPFTTTFCSGNSLRAWIRPGRVGVPTRLGPLHLLASSSLPFLFPAVRIHEAYFGDG
ncbi:MAG: patatin-like phospholipase family protein, partial [Acidobacteria bacterium]|nr:patatin-like phospholipase family protein [Acidobacteriota bacterium]